MKIISRLLDEKVKSINIQMEMYAGEYVQIAKEIMTNNELQRKRVKNAGTIYSLLKSDILEGCLIPPIVLASKLAKIPVMEEIDERYIVGEVLSNRQDLTILDGMQRTYSLLELFEEPSNQERLEFYVLRVEVYLNITEVGILYRMLTLNAGQTPMSLRHQIEILYSGYAGKSIGDINIIRQKDEASKKGVNDYNYSDLIEGYNSYLECNESPMDRYSLLDIVKSLGKISNDNADENSFSRFVQVYHGFVCYLEALTGSWEYPIDDAEVPAEYKVAGRPFGVTTYGIFNRTQALTGFGAAIGALIEQGIVSGLNEVEGVISGLKITDAQDEFLHINKCLDSIKQDAKKIGNAQRLFFRYFFRMIFDKSQSEYFMEFARAADQAMKRTLANM